MVLVACCLGSLAGVATASASAAGLAGACSTLVAPLMDNWINGFKIRDGIPVKYASVGAGEGIEQSPARRVDFGASDAPMTHLPNLRITPVLRSDGSGDTYAFTNYL